MRTSTLRAPAALAVLLAAGPASAHIDLVFPPPRYDQETSDQKYGPCGSGTPTRAVRHFTAGETVEVRWLETIDHPGHFRVSLDPDGGDDDLVDPRSFEDFDVAPSVLLDDIEDGGGANHSAKVKLPDVNCARCTLQVIQVMTDKPPFDGNDLYYRCADIAIDPAPEGAGGGAPATPDTGTPGDDGGCSAAGAGPAGLLAALALLLRRR